jgi:hypothetical protein
MPENETQWRNRERRFQEAVLAALKKPKRDWFFATINSGIVLWLLSAIVIGFGAAVLQNTTAMHARKWRANNAPIAYTVGNQSACHLF